MPAFSHPWFLLAAAPVVLFLPVAMRGSLAGFTRLQRGICLALRTLILLLLVLALCGVRIPGSTDRLTVLYLVDASASITKTAAGQAREFIRKSVAGKHSGDEAGVIGFAKGAEIWQKPAADFRLADTWPAAAAPNATEIGKAIEFAQAVFPGENAKRIVLLTDGNDTGGNALEAARKAAAAGIDIMIVPLRNSRDPEVLVESMDAPRRVKWGEPFDLTAQIHSNTATPAVVRLYQNGFQIGEEKLGLKPGYNPALFRNLKADGKLVTYQVRVIAAADTLLENNQAQAVVSGSDARPRLLIVDPEPDKLRPLAEALRAENIDVQARAVSGLPRAMSDLQQFDLFMLSDVSALNLTPDQMDLYRTWVQDFGGGFVMTGGENSFGVGGYYRTAIEQMLPVWMEHEDREDVPSVALLIVLDRSGSMAAAAQGGQTKISLADQGAVYAMNVLQAKDLFGVMAVDTRVHDVQPLGRLDEKEAAARKIMSITSAGGGIYIYTSLVAAFQALREVNAKIKHVILFSDASDAEEKAGSEMADGTQGGGTALDLVTAMLADKISTSVVGLGVATDKDVDFLKQLSERGNGRFYLTNDAMTLPQIFSTETMKVAQSSLIEEPFQPVQAGASPILEGIAWKEAPFLLGYNRTKPKPTGDVLLATEHGEPLLASWRYGLGQAAAFTSDAKSRWASEWLAWPGFGKFWSQLVRGVMRKTEESQFQVATVETGNHLRLQIDAITPDGKFQNDVPITVTAAREEGGSESKQAAQDAPGSYDVSFELPETGSTIFSIRSKQLGSGDYIFGYTRSYPKEFIRTETDDKFLAALADAATEGDSGQKRETAVKDRINPGPETVFAHTAPPAIHWRELTNEFLAAALVLFPLDIWLRRRTWKTG